MRNLFPILFLFLAMPARGYVISASQWGVQNSPCKQLIMYGDAHIEGNTSKKHFDLMRKELEAISLCNTSTLVVLEDRGWDGYPLQYLNNTLPDLCIYGRAHKGCLGNVTIEQADMRERCADWMSEFAEDWQEIIISTKDMLPKKAQVIIQKIAKKNLSKNGAAPSIQQYKNEIKSVIRELKNYNSPMLTLPLHTLEKKFEIFLRACNQCRATDSGVRVFEDAALQGINSIQKLNDALIEIDSAIADAGFVMSILDGLDEFDTIIFFGGQAHAFTLNQVFKEGAHFKKLSHYGTSAKIPTFDQAQPLSLQTLTSMLKMPQKLSVQAKRAKNKKQGFLGDLFSFGSSIIYKGLSFFSLV